MLPKNCRLILRETDIFKKAFRVIETPLFRVYLLKTDDSKGAVIVSKKQLNKSSKRNLIKRRISSVLLEILPKINKASVIVWVKNKSLLVNQEILTSELEKILSKYYFHHEAI